MHPWLLATAIALAGPPAPPGSLNDAAIAAYADGAEASFRAAADAAKKLRESVRGFCAAPSDSTLAAARSAWVSARAVYGQTEAYRFGEGPIDARRGGVETFVNAWPVDENYIEPSDPGAAAGIIRDRSKYPLLARAAIREHNQRGGETNVCTGWHAIEFMLWGRDSDERGPGNRPASDFADGTADADRRREYLLEITELLCEDLERVARSWKTGAPHRTAFGSDGQRALRAMLVGPALLAGFEMAGERLAVAYETRDQEEEHSCFSDTTDADFKANIRGIARVLRAEGGKPGVIDVVRAASPERADALTKALDAALVAVDAIPAPFDRAIRAPEGSEDRTRLHTAMESLERLGEEITAAAAALGVTLPTEPQG
jgi:putative iron-regulated protein